MTVKPTLTFVFSVMRTLVMTWVVLWHLELPGLVSSDWPLWRSCVPTSEWLYLYCGYLLRLSLSSYHSSGVTKSYDPFDNPSRSKMAFIASIGLVTVVSWFRNTGVNTHNICFCFDPFESSVKILLVHVLRYSLRWHISQTIRLETLALSISSRLCVLRNLISSLFLSVAILKKQDWLSSLSSTSTFSIHRWVLVFAIMK